MSEMEKNKTIEDDRSSKDTAAGKETPKGKTRHDTVTDTWGNNIKIMKRRPNFTRGELSVLADAVMSNLDEFNKKQSMPIVKNVWLKITDQVNKVAPICRTDQEVKKKWQSWRVEVQKKDSRLRMLAGLPIPDEQLRHSPITETQKMIIELMEKCGDNGRVPTEQLSMNQPLTDAEKKVLEIVAKMRENEAKKVMSTPKSKAKLGPSLGGKGKGVEMQKSTPSCQQKCLESPPFSYGKDSGPTVTKKMRLILPAGMHPKGPIVAKFDNSTGSFICSNKSGAAMSVSPLLGDVAPATSTSRVAQEPTETSTGASTSADIAHIDHDYTAPATVRRDRNARNPPSGTDGMPGSGGRVGPPGNLGKTADHGAESNQNLAKKQTLVVPSATKHQISGAQQKDSEVTVVKSEPLETMDVDNSDCEDLCDDVSFLDTFFSSRSRYFRMLRRNALMNAVDDDSTSSDDSLGNIYGYDDRNKNIQELIQIKRKRLEIEKQRLDVEKEMMQIEKTRLELEIKKQKLKLAVQKLKAQV